MWLLVLFLDICYVLLGGWCLGDAIINFKNEKYRAFGFDTMIFLATIVQLTAAILI